MPYHDNPAGRLHDLLTQLNEQHHASSLLDGWAGVLGVNAVDVVVHLGRVAELVRQTQEAVDRVGEGVYVQTVQRYRSAWARPIFPVDHAFKQALMKVVPDDRDLEALGMVSVHLHLAAPEGVVPEDDKVEELLTQVRELIDGVRIADDIPHDLKHVVILRLQDVRDALEHLNVGGPAAVRHATEAVIGSMALMTVGTDLSKSSTLKKVFATVAVAWTVFSAPPTIENSLESWEKILPQLTAAIEKPFETTEGPPSNPPVINGDGGTEAPAANDMSPGDTKSGSKR